MVEAVPEVARWNFVDVIDLCNSRIDWSKDCLKVISAGLENVTSHLLQIHDFRMPAKISSSLNEMMTSVSQVK